MKNNDVQNIDKASIEKQTFELVNTVYSLLPSLPETEDWATTTNLRTSANMMLFYVAEGVASSTHSGELYAWSIAKKNAAAMKAMLHLAQTQEMCGIDSSIIKQIDTAIIKQIDVLMLQINICIKLALKADEREEKKRLAGWLKQYKIWKETEIRPNDVLSNKTSK